MEGHSGAIGVFPTIEANPTMSGVEVKVDEGRAPPDSANDPTRSPQSSTAVAASSPQPDRGECSVLAPFNH